MRADMLKTAAPIVGGVVGFAGIAVAWDSPLKPVDSLELVYAAIVIVISGTLGVIAGRVLWKKLGKPGIAMIAGLVITTVSAPWALLGAWAVNGAAIDTPIEHADCVLVEAKEPATYTTGKSQSGEELYECTTGQRSFTMWKILDGHQRPHDLGFERTVTVRRGRLGWSIAAAL
jgi:hypothetical protein